jgi:capsular polysaccharide export protein
MHLLFFSTAKHQWQYFKRLQQHLGYECVQFFFPTFLFSFKNMHCYKTLDINEVLENKKKELLIKYKNPLHRWFYYQFLKLQIPWLVSTLHDRIITHKIDMLVVWNGKKFHQEIAVKVAESLGIACVYFENGVLPDTTTMDFNGVNAAASVPKKVQFYQNLHFPFELGLPKNLVPRIGKKNHKKKEVSLPDKYIFVPFQVAYDTQILQYSPWIEDMYAFYKVLLSISKDIDLPIVIKEHPSDRVSNYENLYTSGDNSIIFSSGNTQTLIENAELIMSINSSVVIESLLFSKRVIVLGDAFFAIDGIVKLASNKEEIVTLINNRMTWKVDHTLLENFLKYLYYCYLIPGSWKKPGEQHYQMIRKRFENWKNKNSNLYFSSDCASRTTAKDTL